MDTEQARIHAQESLERQTGHPEHSGYCIDCISRQLANNLLNALEEIKDLEAMNMDLAAQLAEAKRTSSARTNLRGTDRELR